MGRPDPFVRRVADAWLVLGLLGALLGLGLLFVHLPAALWAGNTGEFHWRFVAYLRLGLAAVAAGLVVTLLVLILVPRTGRAVLASLLCAVSLVAWGYAFLLAGHMNVLNGLDAPMNFETRIGAWEVALAGAVAVLLALAIRRARYAAISALLVLNLGLGVATTVSVRAARHHRFRTAIAQDVGPMFRFSTRDNVLIVLLDGLQSDIADAVFRDDPQLASAFEGFHFYRDTLGVAPTTFVSLPAIHAGTDDLGHEGLGAYFEESIRARSFMSRFADAGYDAALVNPMEGVCPERVRTCLGVGQIMRTPEAQLRSESLRLFDISLFRLAPVWLKRRIYDNGNWLLAGQFDMAEETRRVPEHNALLADMARRIRVDHGPPTIKFVHSLATHTPFVLNRDCHTLEPTSWAQLVPQARCGLLAVATLLNALKAAQVYDATEIVVLADHGIGQPNGYIPHVATVVERDAEWARRAGYANPLFLLKRRGARGTMTGDGANVYLPDLGATLCISSGACVAAGGMPVGTATADRPRQFLDYEWRHEFWRLRDVPSVTRYEVRGALWEPESWRGVSQTGEGGR